MNQQVAGQVNNMLNEERVNDYKEKLKKERKIRQETLRRRRKLEHKKQKVITYLCKYICIYRIIHMHNV